MKIYLVGGAVRDQLLGLIVKERDWVVVGATPQELLDQGYQQVGRDFPVFIHPQTGEEYALARTERKTGKGYTGFSCYAAPDVTLEDDLKRRDLTINAIAQAESGEIIDPYHGQSDLKNKILKHISPAFEEDPLRVLRVARFAAQFADLGFQIAESTKQLMLKIVNNKELNELTTERVWQELHKALATNQPQLFLQVLRECGGLPVLFPEINNLFGVPNPPKHHPEIDSGIHTLLALQQAAKLTDDPQIRFAVLVHDLGKALTPITDWPKHPRHGERGVALIKQFCQRLRVPKDYQLLAEMVSHYHIECHQVQEFSEKAILNLLEKLDAFRRPQRFQQFLTACFADVRGRTGLENQSYSQQDFLNAAYQAANTVDTKRLIEKGLEGAALGDAIRKMRIAAIKKLLEKKK